MTRPQALPKLTFTPDEVGRMIGMSEAWVREQIRYQRVPHLRFGRRVAFRSHDVATILGAFGVDVVPEPEDTTTTAEQIEKLDNLATLGLSPQSLARHQRMRRRYDGPPHPGEGAVDATASPALPGPSLKQRPRQSTKQPDSTVGGPQKPTSRRSRTQHDLPGQPALFR